ncbi:MAG TPA: exosortase/archaeosortase family protein [Candidatus Thermoplasmatota archaeon]|nr:exosortase/archaeosortase family protein [Candidatus Thermoplasmatota archaeon]
MTTRSAAVTAAFLGGILLAGYGGLILADLLAHESPLVGAFLLLGGGLLAWAACPRALAPVTPQAPPPRAASRVGVALAVGLGLLLSGGTLLYNLLASSSLSTPELALVGYGLLLLVAAPHLHKRVGPVAVGKFAAWSVPLLGVPLGMYALDAAIEALGADSPFGSLIAVTLVAPMAAALSLLGIESSTIGQTLILATPAGTLSLGVGLVCAGIHPSLLFLGVFTLYAWEEETPPRRLAALLILGLAGVYLANLARLVALALVGYHWGGVALQQAHAHLGWLLFVAWMGVYWWLVLRRFQGPRPAPSA